MEKDILGIRSLGLPFFVTDPLIHSDSVVKINPKDKPQQRIICVTNTALYNLIPSSHKCKRKLLLSNIANIVLASETDEFLLHCPREYDYRLLTSRKLDMIAVIRKAYLKLTGKKLPVIKTEVPLKSICITKRVSRSKKLRPVAIANRLEFDRTATVISLSDDEPIAKASSRRRRTTGWSREQTTVTLEDFDLLKVIGRGSFGKVMQVRKRDSDKIYAMKILKKSVIIGRNQVEHTRAERQILEEMNHPFLVKLHYAFQTNDKLYLVLDYLTGGELFFHLKQKHSFDEEQSRLYAAELICGIGHLHEKGIIYRDLKPENILLDCGGHIRLTDFGLSKAAQADQPTHSFCGTPEYLAPEVIADVGHGKDVDWWSLGVLIFELLTGIPPFYSENVHMMYDLIENAPLRFPRTVSPDAQDLISKLLDRNPKTRLGSGEDDSKAIKSHKWFACLDWDMLLKKEIPSGFVPHVVNVHDTSNFDREFTSEPACDSVAEMSPFQSHHKEFQGFTFRPKSELTRHH
eukprot:TRINITY_DN5325_c0_g1_i1.p1 TRINITY_DN5325_c0_g1~~TRINITY_DN5325_c0_g1_i1.p1  ORF type:complete len:518 (-),score=134.14 TRINITY_DN5325_c0_g1_i1:420-1973(-)